ncbi:S-type pyocin domain-containing protein [Pseudomonas sp. 8Z]|uniref:S-type pyocin domain-containing protein n=1 Tax=Pseudomonas sp. 8Z TaxID=2653166 RepID=UPI001356F279|nr:S-type pyocin domain-containing protein [Pseudomonas sp. 8Z]
MSGYVPNDRGKRPAPVIEPYNGDFDKQPPRPLVLAKQPETTPEKAQPVGCVFAKSCNLPNGVINHNNPGGFVPLEQLKDYGDWAVLGTGTVIRAGGTPLQLIGSSTAATTIASRLGGALSLGLIEGGAMMAAGAVLGTIGMLLPNTTSADSALYTKEQYYGLTLGRTRVRVHVQQLSADTINAYGFYTGRKPEWETAQVIAATPRGEQFVADLGQGIEVIWTPAADPNELGIPALEGAPKLPSVWVYPPTEQSNKALVNPVHPPDYQDAIIWFPATDIPPIYVVLSVRNQPGVVTGQGQDVTGIWLADAGKALGSPIPSHIADQLRGREFSRFDDFREAFWQAVGNDSQLSSQFIVNNRLRMLAGKAPKVRKADVAGKRTSFELHHIEKVSEGGEVYDVDNLGVTTPKHHIDLHRGL